MSGPLRHILPHLIIGLAVSLIMVGAYIAVGMASSNSPKALFSINPVTIQFSGSGGVGSSGSFGDSFKCAPPVSTAVNLRTSVSNPAKISLTVNPSGAAACGPSFTTITVTAHCLVSNCKGSYTGTITIFKGQYNTIPPSLSVSIIVT